MPLLLKQAVDSDCLLGIWEITESYDDLFSRLTLDDRELRKLKSFSCNSRKLEWLSVRALLKELSPEKLRISYRNRKPLFKNTDYEISISHSYHLSSIMLSKKKRVGIDLEYMSHRISRIEKKFIGPEEYIVQDKELKKYHLYIHWCAKEALYKICDKEDINFKENLFIEPFEPKDEGVIKGHVKNVYGHEEFDLKYFRNDNYIIVYTIK